MHIGLVTCERIPELPPEEQLLIKALGVAGVKAEATVWSNPSIRWNDYDALVIRSTWDYHLRLAEFFAWMDSVTVAGVPIWNPPSLLRWNAEKTYLRDLASRGANVVPTRYVAAGEDTALSAILDETGWDHAIVKPTVSAGAFETWRLTRTDTPTHDARFRTLSAKRSLMVQPFLPEIATAGEWSLMFIGGAFSHAVLKKPARGDFRVQEELGGSSTPQQAPADVVEAARGIVALAPGPWIYARVDGCVIGKSLQLLELEMFEPSLFLGASDTAAATFARAIVESLQG